LPGSAHRLDSSSRTSYGELEEYPTCPGCLLAATDEYRRKNDEEKEQLFLSATDGWSERMPRDHISVGRMTTSIK
jgi:hypothetical protein